MRACTYRSTYIIHTYIQTCIQTSNVFVNNSYALYLNTLALHQTAHTVYPPKIIVSDCIRMCLDCVTVRSVIKLHCMSSLPVGSAGWWKGDCERTRL